MKGTRLDTVEIRLPNPTLKELKAIAKLSGCTLDQVLNVILAAFVLKQKVQK